MDTTTTLRVGGMTCDNCVRHAASALLTVPGVHKARVDLASGTAVIETAGEPSRDAIAAALENEGFELS